MITLKGPYFQFGCQNFRLRNSRVLCGCELMNSTEVGLYRPTIGNDISWSNWDLCVLNTCANAHRTLVNILILLVSIDHSQKLGD